jgi:signal transduction histidine kinase
MLTGTKHKSSNTVCLVPAPLRSLEQIITQAENNDLVPEISSFESLTLLKEVRSGYDTSCLSPEKIITLDSTSQSVLMTSDRKLLSHVIRQMIANAVEASPMGQMVDLGCIAEQNHCTFWVLNKTVIPKFVQNQIFHRDFSTKHLTRGLGTHGIKLFAETYLKGHVTFTSKPNEGTVFKATFPLELSAKG